MPNSNQNSLNKSRRYLALVKQERKLLNKWKIKSNAARIKFVQSYSSADIVRSTIKIVLVYNYISTKYSKNLKPEKLINKYLKNGIKTFFMPTLAYS